MVSYSYLGAAGGVLEEVEILSPAYDYVPPRFVSTFVIYVGGNSPSYIYRLLEECYCEEGFFLMNKESERYHYTISDIVIIAHYLTI